MMCSESSIRCPHSVVTRIHGNSRSIGFHLSAHHRQCRSNSGCQYSVTSLIHQGSKLKLAGLQSTCFPARVLPYCPHYAEHPVRRVFSRCAFCWRHLILAAHHHSVVALPISRPLMSEVSAAGWLWLWCVVYCPPYGGRIATKWAHMFSGIMHGFPKLFILHSLMLSNMPILGTAFVDDLIA